jgi:hypothetical protein
MPRQYTPDPVVDVSGTLSEVSPPPATNWERFSRKFKEEPLVPIGAYLPLSFVYLFMLIPSRDLQVASPPSLLFSLPVPLFRRATGLSSTRCFGIVSRRRALPS